MSGVSEKIRRWIDAHPYWTLVFLTLAALCPFLAKPFNIDDPLFLWSAKQIVAHPFDPYGFNVEWGWTQFPMFKVTENPPLACYYLALAGKLFGWGEIGLHLAFLLPAIAAVCGTHRLAKHFCSVPLLAAGLLLCAPVFWISATSVMCDVLMLAGWVWALVFWIEGIAQNSSKKMFAAGVLIALAAMTKYFGASLIPLLAAYSLAMRRPLIQWGPCLLIGLATLCAYQFWSEAVYGQNLLYRATEYALVSKQIFGLSKLQNALVALAFVGGSMPALILLAPAWMKGRGLAVATGTFIVAAVIVFADAALWKKYGALQGGAVTSAAMQLAFWMVGGAAVVALVVADFRRQRDASALLLALWVLGVFWFAAFCNWTVNGRSILPLTPAVAILIVRQLKSASQLRPYFMPAGMVVCVLLSGMIVRSDYLKAKAVRECASQVQQAFKMAPGTIWFEGHWGFQYYMEAIGARAVDFKHPELKPGDLLVVPADNTNIRLLDSARAGLLGSCRVPGPAWITTLNASLGASFYASLLGPLPVAIGAVPPEGVSVYQLK
jgi:4-amino-4-deoxy-L-arabinose transferase-like glycosyltransferase